MVQNLQPSVGKEHMNFEPFTSHSQLNGSGKFEAPSNNLIGTM